MRSSAFYGTFIAKDKQKLLERYFSVRIHWKSVRKSNKMYLRRKGTLRVPKSQAQGKYVRAVRPSHTYHRVLGCKLQVPFQCDVAEHLSGSICNLNRAVDIEKGERMRFLHSCKALAKLLFLTSIEMYPVPSASSRSNASAIRSSAISPLTSRVDATNSVYSINPLLSASCLPPRKRNKKKSCEFY